MNKKKPLVQEKRIPMLIFIDRYSLLITLLLAVSLIMIIFGDFILGNAYYLFTDIASDSMDAAYPNFYHFSQYIRDEGFPMWSFSQGMGQNIMVPALMDPFFWIIYIAGPAHIMPAVIWMEIAKILLTALLFFQFLKLRNVTPVVSMIGALIYPFSGFMIIGSAWTLFSTEALYLAFLLFSFEQLYTRKVWYYFPFAVALIVILQPLYLFIYGIFLVIYLLYRHFSEPSSSWKQLVSLTLRMAGCTLLGMLMSSIFLLQSVQLILESPRGGGGASYLDKLLSTSIFFVESKLHYATAILRLYSNDLLGISRQFQGWYNYLEAPLFYSSLLVLLLAPQYFFLAGKREKITASNFLFICILPVVFPFFRYGIWAFSGDYYRGYSLFVVLALLFCALGALDLLVKGKKLNLLVLSATLILLIVLLFIPYPGTRPVFDEELGLKIVLYLVLFTVSVALFRFKSISQYLPVVLLLLLVIELSTSYKQSFENRSPVTHHASRQKTGYSDYSLDAVRFINEKDKGFFRVNKDVFCNPAVYTSFNDAKVQGYYGTMSYYSFNQKFYIRFLQELGVIKPGDEYGSRWCQGLVNRPLLLTLVSNKYHLNGVVNPMFPALGYDSIATFGNIEVLKNRHFLPLGFLYDHWIDIESFRHLSAFQKDITLLRAVVLEDEQNPVLKSMKKMGVSDTATNYSYQDYFMDVDSLRRDTMDMALFSQNRIRGEINVSRAGLLFFSIPFDKGWHARVDGKPAEMVLANIGFCGLLLETGSHQVEFYYEPPYFYLGLILTFSGILLYLILILIFWYFRTKDAHELP